MSLEVKISLDEKTNSFVIFNCTGNYSGDNKGGYGPPNYKASDIQESYLEIQPPSATTEYPYKIDTTGDLPNSEGLGFEVQPSEVGQNNDEMESGLWKFKYTEVFTLKSGGTKTKVAYLSEVLTKSLECCISKHTGKLDKNAFKDPRQRTAIELSTLFQDVIYQIKAGRFDHANSTIEYLKSKCQCQGC